MLLVFLTFSLLPLASCTHAPPAIKPHPHAKYMFRDSDTNHDGILQRAEQRVIFNRYDSNGDTRVSRVEYVSYQVSAAPGSSILAHVLFSIYDVDNDHMLDAHDYENFYRLMDLNGNGLVSKDEFIYFWTMVLKHVQHLIPQRTKGTPIFQPRPLANLMFDDADTNNDQLLQRLEMWTVFNRYDSNGDDRVSRLEYVRYQESSAPGTTALAHFLFDIYDVDNDNMLDSHDYDHTYRLMDSNKNGYVWKNEFIHFWTALLESVKHLIPRKKPTKALDQASK